MKYGYIVDKIKDTDYVLGGQTPIEGAILSPTGQWLNRISGGEAQRRFGVETMSCVSFGTLNIVEILIKELFDVIANYSDRYLSSMAQTTTQGNSPTKVFDTLRKVSGCVDEQDLPFDESVKSFNDYIVPILNIPKTLTRKGEEWRSKYELKYERAFNGGDLKYKQAQLMEALKRSPIGVSVVAWAERNGLYYKPQEQDNHFTLLVGYEEGKKWFVYDSYPESEGDFIKELEWDYDFGCAFVFYLRNIEGEVYWIESVIAWVKSLIPSFKKQVEDKIEEKKTDTIEEPKYLWSTPSQACHSFRVICDEVGLSVSEKNLLAKILNCESGFNINAKYENKDKNGNVWSVDNGICQYNDYWYKDLITPEEALNNPEKACRLYIDEYKAGRLNNWVCYKSGKFQLYDAKVG